MPPPVATESGGDDVAIVEAPTGADGPAPSDDSTSHGDADPLDRLLAEYDERNGAGNGAAASGATDDDIVRLLDEANRDAAAQARNEHEFAAAQQRYTADLAQSAMEIAQRDHQVAELQQTIGSLQQTIWAEQQRQHRLQSKADFDALVAPVQAELEAAGLDIPPNHVETQLLAAAARDPALIEAFEFEIF